MRLLQDFRTRWRIARAMADAQAHGEVLIRVPGHLAATVQQYAWHLKVETASERWAAQVAEVPLAEWQAAITGRHAAQQGRQRTWPPDKSLPGSRTPLEPGPGLRTVRDNAVRRSNGGQCRAPG